MELNVIVERFLRRQCWSILASILCDLLILDLENDFRKLLFHIKDYLGIKRFRKKTWLLHVNQSILSGFNYLNITASIRSNFFRKLLFNIKDYFGIRRFYKENWINDYSISRITLEFNWTTLKSEHPNSDCSILRVNLEYLCHHWY